MFDGNRVTAHTRSRYPIFQSPMTWIARAPLACFGQALRALAEDLGVPGAAQEAA